MKHLYYSLLCFVLLLSNPAKAQFDATTYDKEKFLIGTLNEYMGYDRSFTPRHSFDYQRIDILHQEELKNALFIDSLFQSDHPDITLVNNGAPMGIKLYSSSLSQIVDQYFDYTQSPSQSDSVYSGRLKKDRFQTDKDKLSFLLGVYLMYGLDETKATDYLLDLKQEVYPENRYIRSEKVHGISLPNSSPKAQISAELLKSLGCKKVQYVQQFGIPYRHFVFFKPSTKVKKIIQESHRLKSEIESISTDHATFTPDGTKFIWQEPDYPHPLKTNGSGISP